MNIRSTLIALGLLLVGGADAQTPNNGDMTPSAAPPSSLVTGAPANNDCAKFVVSNGVVQSITTAGGACAGAGAVSSVFGRTGAVVAAGNDYSFGQLSGSWTLAQGPTLGSNTVLGSVAGGIPAQLTQAQLTALLNLATASLQGALPAWPNNTTTFFRGDGTYQTLNFGAVGGQASLAQLPTIGANTTLGSIAGGTPIALTQTQLTSLINAATATLSGALPAWPNNTTTYFRGDGTYQTHSCAALTNAAASCATDATNANNISAGTLGVARGGSGTRLAVADAAGSPTVANSIVAYTSITVSRTVAIPAANTAVAGQKLIVIDESGSVTPAITISVAPTGADTLQNSNTTQVAIATARGFVEFETDGVSAWNVTKRSEDFQTFTASGTWNRVIGSVVVDLFGCAQGGGGGGGIVNATASGGGGGGGGDCHPKSFKAADIGATGTVTITTNANAGAAAASGTVGGNTTFAGTVTETWFGGGGGGLGIASTNSVGGQGGSPWGAGAQAATTSNTGCNGTSSGGGNGAAPADTFLCGGGGGGSVGATGLAKAASYSFGAAGGGGSGGGVAAGTGLTGAPGKGGGSLGCQTPPSGGALNTNGAGPTNALESYLPGCGGAGGGGGSSGTAGTGSAGTGGGGGGGGGSVNTGGTAGAGGQGGAGLVAVRAK